MVAMTRTDRYDILQDLLDLRTPLPQAVAAVKELAWDSDVELLLLTRRQVSDRLRGYLDGLLTAADLETWANTVECREDIGYESGAEELLAEFLFEVANPVLSNEISTAVAADWISRLTR